MFKLIKKLIFAWRYKRAVKHAVRLSQDTGRKYLVLYLNKRLWVVSKQNIRRLVQTHRFRKGTTVADIESHALFVTK